MPRHSRGLAREALVAHGWKKGVGGVDEITWLLIFQFCFWIHFGNFILRGAGFASHWQSPDIRIPMYIISVNIRFLDPNLCWIWPSSIATDSPVLSLPGRTACNCSRWRNFHHHCLPLVSERPFLQAITCQRQLCASVSTWSPSGSFLGLLKLSCLASLVYEPDSPR
jgi:hypothetical protein